PITSAARRGLWSASWTPSPTRKNGPTAATVFPVSPSTGCAFRRARSGPITPDPTPTPWTWNFTSTGSNPPEGSSKPRQDSSISRALPPLRGPPREDAMHAHEGHTHPHPTLPDADAPPTYYQRLETAVRELLISRGVISADDVRRKVEVIDSQTP